MARVRKTTSALIEPLGSDLVALAQAHALDATVFPHPSIPPVFGGDVAPTVWIARHDHGGPVVGFIATKVDRTTLEIAGLAVDDRHRRAGIGRALVRAAVRSARSRGMDAVELHVSTGNGEALALYTGERFRKDRRIAGFYSPRRFPDGGDAWVMIKDV